MNKVLSESDVASAAQSPVVATEFLAELLVSHETLRGQVKELARSRDYWKGVAVTACNEALAH